MIIVEKSGTSRMYLQTFDLKMTIPSVEALIQSPDDEVVKIFMQHVVLNHKGLNWKIFRHYLNDENYKSFIYAFAYICKDFPTSYSTSWQIESNARRLAKAVERNKISLTKVEADLIHFCESFKYCCYTNSAREEHLSKVLRELKYLG